MNAFTNGNKWQKFKLQNMANIKSEMIKGVLWTAVQNYSGIIIQLGITAILARLLSPDEFGIVAIATVLIVFFQLFSEMGLGASIIQNQELDKRDVDIIFSFSVYVGVVLAVLFFFSSFLIAYFYGNEELILICQLLSLVLLFASFNVVPNALIQKSKRFRFIALRTLCFQLIGGFVSAIMAIYGCGYFSLLFAPIFTAIGCFIVNYREVPLRFYSRFDFSSIKKIFSYSLYLFLFNIFNYFTRNLDKLLVGRCFGLSDLGYYEKSYRLMMLPLQQVTHIINPVLHPVLTQLQSNYYALAINYAKIIKLLAIIGFPLSILLYFTAEDLILIVFGKQWLLSVPVFKILALSVPTQIVMSSTGGIFQSAGRTDLLFYAGSFHSINTIIGFLVATLFFGQINAVAWAIVLTFNVQLLIALFCIYNIALKQSISLAVKELVHPLLLSASLFCILFFWINNFSNPFVDLVIKTVIVLFFSCVYIQFFHLYDLLDIIKQALYKTNKYGRK